MRTTHSKKKFKRTSSKSKNASSTSTQKHYKQTPITIEEILEGPKPVSYEESKGTTTREMSVFTDPANINSPKIKQFFIPLSDGDQRIVVPIRAIHLLKKGCIGNALTTGPPQFAYYRACLDGEALRQFNVYATDAGTETVEHLNGVANNLIGFFSEKDILAKQKRYMRYAMTKPHGTKMRQFVGAVRTLNSMLASLPPNFNVAQCMTDTDLITSMAQMSDKPYKMTMIDSGFDPENATFQQLIDVCERTELKFEAANGKSTRFLDEDMESSDDDIVEWKARSSKFPKRNKNPTSEKKVRKKSFFCKIHGDNDSHPSSECKILLAKDGSGKPRGEKRAYKDYKKEYKQKSRDLNLLQKDLSNKRSLYAKQKKKYELKTLRLEERIRHGDTNTSESDVESGEEPDRKPAAFSPDNNSSSSDDSSSSRTAKTEKSVATTKYSM